MNLYESNISQWKEFLIETDDISHKDHKKYFLDLIDIVLEPSFDVEKIEAYKHSIAGFYRWEIFSILYNNNNYKVRYHDFQKEQVTNLHTHGYEGHSFLLDGKIDCTNIYFQDLSIHFFNKYNIFINQLFDLHSFIGNKESILLQENFNTLKSYTSLDNLIKSGSLKDFSINNIGNLHKLYELGVVNVDAYLKLYSQIHNNDLTKSRLKYELLEQLLNNGPLTYHTLLFSQAFGITEGKLLNWLVAKNLITGEEFIKEISKVEKFDCKAQSGIKEFFSKKFGGKTNNYSIPKNAAHSIKAYTGTKTLFINKSYITNHQDPLALGYIEVNDIKINKNYTRSAREEVIKSLKQIKNRI